MKAVLIAALLVASAAPLVDAAPKWHELEGYTFDQYKKDFRKTYSGSEDSVRRTTFETRLAEVKAHNSRRPSPSWRMGINKLTDRNEAELKALNGRIPHSEKGALYTSGSLKGTGREYVPSDKPLPASVDWRNKGVLTAVKDQGDCGSCWAVAAAQTIETQMAIKTGLLYVLSLAQLTSCVPNPDNCGGSGGCMGATAKMAYDFVAKVGGITEEWMYPYYNFFGETGTCITDNSDILPAVKVDGYTFVKPNSPTDLMSALANDGPLAITIAASEMFFYESGVFRGCDYTNNITMNHAVQVVGYGHDATVGMDYWLVRNSWSVNWGEAGYIRMYKEPAGTAPECGWDNEWDTMGGGCEGGVNHIWACGQCGILYETVFPSVLRA